MCPLPIFRKIISLTTCCVLGGPLNVSYLREPPHCFVEDTSSRQMSDGLTPAVVVVTFFPPVTSRTNVAIRRVDKYRRDLYFVTSEDLFCVCVCVCSINFEGKIKLVF